MVDCKARLWDSYSGFRSLTFLYAPFVRTARRPFHLRLGDAVDVRGVAKRRRVTRPPALRWQAGVVRQPRGGAPGAGSSARQGREIAGRRNAPRRVGASDGQAARVGMAAAERIEA